MMNATDKAKYLCQADKLKNGTDEQLMIASSLATLVATVERLEELLAKAQDVINRQNYNLLNIEYLSPEDDAAQKLGEELLCNERLQRKLEETSVTLKIANEAVKANAELVYKYAELLGYTVR
jgi:hypothetical protein